MASAPFNNLPLSAVQSLHPPAAFAASGTHPGTFAPGTKVQVGQHRVVVEKYLSEGGFAHVYVVRVPRAETKYDVAVLKRVAVPDKDHLANMRTEVETMKKLKGHKHIVTYIDSHASQLKGGGYEVFLLMEYCQGGGLIDFMNTRLQNRLTEPEILKIFSDVAEGVACMHYLKPPLLHRDLKVENVLISTSGSARTYKICDFGSAAPPRPAATTAAEARLIEDDVQRHTTVQYRSPEMVDVFRKEPIDEKSDIWALGVLLYKLCYYTTPFEDQGQMAILNASFKFPNYPSFSDRLKKLISSMLRENPQLRPNIFQVVTEVCSMRNTNVPIKDIYASRSKSETRRYQELPSAEPNTGSPSPVIGIQKVEPVQAPQTVIPEIVPMRRGRPTAQQLRPSSKGTPAGSRGNSSDPFAALDSDDQAVRAKAVEDLQAKWPSLEEFSLLHDQGAKFEFTQSTAVDSKQESLNKRVTEALADEAFEQARGGKSEVPAAKSTMTTAGAASLHKTRSAESGVAPASSSQPALLHQPSPQRPLMVSTGIQTSPRSSPPPSNRSAIKDRPIWRVPRSKSPILGKSPGWLEAKQLPEISSSEQKISRPGLLQRQRTKSQSEMRLTVSSRLPQSAASSRPSLEGQRPSALDINDATHRSKSANSRPRPSSFYLESNVDYLRDRERARNNRLSGDLLPRAETNRPMTAVANDSSDDEGPVDPSGSDLAFLRSRESDNNKRKSRQGSNGHKKRSSLGSISLSGTKNILAGKFGDAFRRFEGSSNAEPVPRTPSPTPDNEPLRSRILTPIAGSEATGTSGRSDDEAIDETEDLSPEVRRELERRRLSEEEKRVATAAAEYRKRLDQGGRMAAGPSKASSIQNRIKALTDESRNAPPPARTAEGYGRFTNVAKSSEKPGIARKPVSGSITTGAGDTKSASSTPTMSAAVASSQSVPVTHRTGPKPNVAPKPRSLRTGASGAEVGSAGAKQGEKEQDLEAAFAKKYPSLAGLEMVEMEIGSDSGMPSARQDHSAVRLKDV